MTIWCKDSGFLSINGGFYRKNGKYEWIWAIFPAKKAFSWDFAYKKLITLIHNICLQVEKYHTNV